MSVYAASIDDNDPQVLYSDGWVLVTQDGDWTGTMHSTSVIGSTARVRFTGSRVAVVCTIPTGDGQLSQASFSLDNGPAVQMSHVTTPPVQWQTVFWDSGPLALGSHLLVITNTGNQDYFRLDHIDYDPTSGNSPSSGSSSGGSSGLGKTTTIKTTSVSTLVVGNSPSSSGSGPLVTSQASSTGTNAPSQSVSVSIETVVHGSVTSLSSSTSISSTTGNTASSAAAAATSSSSSNSPTAGIVAGILGGLLAIVLLVLAFLYLRRRRRSASGLRLNDGDLSRRSENTAIPTPFSLNGAPSEMSSSNHRSNPSLVSPYGSSSFDTSHSPINSTSMYTSGSEMMSASGQYGQQQFQHLGAAGTPAAGSRSKRAEFMAEQQQQQAQLVDAPGVSASGHHGGEVAGTVYSDQDAPPAYPGRV